MKIHFFSINNIISGVITGLINGGIAFSHMNAGEMIPISVDQISNTQQTVLGQSVSTAFIHGVISTLITSKVFAKKVAKESPELIHLVKRPIFPNVLMMAINNAIFMFGWFVIAALLWQRFIGSISLDRVAGSFLIGLFAGLIAMVVSFRTENTLLR